MYEIEIKSLLGSEDRARALKEKLSARDPNTTLISKSAQLNHYFVGGDVRTLAELASPLLSEADRAKLHEIAEKGSDFSVRTREADGKVLLVVKASVDSGTSSNAVSRMEFEAAVPKTLAELDALVGEAGFAYQAKWSREREAYASCGATVCIDRNAGYGYLAEFERVIDDAGAIERTRDEIAALMRELGIEELPQDRLERMFAFYNEHWPEYYGTDKIFTIQ